MSTELQSFIRHLLTAIGAFFMGRALFGGTVIFDSSLLEGIIGFIISLVGIVWSIKEKAVDIEKLQGVVRQAISLIGGVLVASGRIDNETLTIWAGILLALIPFLQSMIMRKKSRMLLAQRISPVSLKK